MQTILMPQGVRVSYFQGEAELLTGSDLYGFISGNLGYLLEIVIGSQPLCDY